MEEQESKVTQYLVPANVATRFEFIEGFGWYELKIVLIACLIGTVIFFGLGIFKKTIYLDVNNVQLEVKIGPNGEKIKPNVEGMIEKRVPIIPTFLRAFAIIVPGFAAFTLVKRDPSNGMSLMYTVKAAREFKRKQKLYLYKYNSGADGGMKH